ncbi:IstB domain-containing protein ATP-binding protein [Rhodococcus opacus RKJ300 = JCM 13270]|uniref:IstB domain-containing protein ATP-binding protein n=1 Tax=Rhodococcus opacus RKJ300 = JCM 13270 TaxID=1165867 RepID=I0W696_RHOOP|nr:IstB domain-containing protein ATP-binding protein [Rhodococcus opacus RKJ300 = JCM 13270]
MPPLRYPYRDNSGVGISRVIPISGLLDDFALRPLDATETNDFYELVVERHRRKATIVSSNRSPDEWLSMTTDALLAQSAIDWLTSAAHTLVIEGPSYRRPGRGAIDNSEGEVDAR